MAKLSELRTLIDARRASTPSPAASAAKTPSSSGGATDRAGSPKRDAPASPARRIAASKHADGDVDLAAAFADVEPIKPSNKAPVRASPPAPVPRQRIADERDALEASKYGEDPAPASWDIGQEPDGEQTFLRPGLGSDVLTKLRRGHWKVQSEIDLHGHVSDEAHDALADFLVAARTHGLRCVRVIHGKGNGSPGREPVLKSKVRAWLVQKTEVIAFTQASAADGGHGAVLVLLRAR